jgi:Tol biopolymer transport system component
MTDWMGLRVTLGRVGTLVLLASLALMGGACGGSNPFAPGVTPTYSPVHSEPDWSQQGLIAYHKRASTYYEPSGMWVLDPETGDESLLIENGYTPAWSTDGLKIVCSINGGIATFTVDGTLLNQVSSGGWDYSPSWSPDDSLVVWHAPFADRGGLWAAPATGGPEENWYEEGWFPDWHPSGDRILFAGRQDSIKIIGEYWMATGEVTALMSDTDSERWWDCPQYSPDASRIAYVQRAAGELAQVWVCDADGTARRRLTNDGGAHPSWSPDGSRIVYVREDYHSDAHDVGVLWVLDVATGVSEQLTDRDE